MSCECHQIGGRFIAEDPDCGVHGLEVQREAERRDRLVDQLGDALDSEDPNRIKMAARDAMYYLRSL